MEFQKYLDNECETVLAMMKSAFGTYNKLSAAGYNEEAMGYYKLIPSQGKCKKEADAIYASYKKGLNPQKIKDWEKADKEWQFKVSQQTADNSYRALQEEMKAKIAIEGNVSYSGNTAKFISSTAFAAETLYTMTITTGAKNLEGTALANNMERSFTTNANVAGFIFVINIFFLF